MSLRPTKIERRGVLRVCCLHPNQYGNDPPLVLEGSKKVWNAIRMNGIQWKLLLPKLMNEAAFSQPRKDECKLIFAIKSMLQPLQPFQKRLRTGYISKRQKIEHLPNQRLGNA